MRYPYLIALAMTMAMPTVSTRAVEPTADQRLGRHRKAQLGGEVSAPPRVELGLFGGPALLRFRLVGGRLAIDPMRYRKGFEEAERGDVHESIHVSREDGIPTAAYVYQDPERKIHLTAEYGGLLRIESTLKHTGERARLEQRTGEAIRWTVERTPGMDHPLDVAVSGSTLLHIIGDDPGGFEVHLEELITRLLRGRSPMELAERTERFLVRHVGTLTYISRDEVRELVDQLAASKSSARRAAAIKLQRMGTRVVPHLQRHLRREGLEPEQIARIQVLLKSFPLIDEDTPSSLACLLSADQSHWRILAARMNAPQREAANEHLRRCGLETLRR